MTLRQHILIPSQVTELLGISRRTLDRWHARRIGPPRISAGRIIVYRRSAVEAWLKANETRPTMTFSGKPPN